MCLNEIEDISNGIIQHNPDILLFESEQLFPQSLDLLKNIHRIFPTIKLLVVSGLVSHDYLNELMQVIDGYILRTCQADKLVSAVYQINESEKYLCPQVVNSLFNQADHHNQIRQVLSSREREIFLLWFQLEDISAIAEKLHISPSTVRTHLKNIRDKLGNPSLAKMVFYACQENQVTSNSGSVCPYCQSICNTMQMKLPSSFTNP